MTLSHPAIRHRFALPATLTLALGLLLLLPLAGCGGDEPETVMQEDDQAAAGAETEGSPIGPVRATQDDTSGAAPAGAAQGAASGAGIRWDWPEGWQTEPPANNMRLAQAVIPSDAGAGDMVVFYFGPGGGGGTEANIERWIGQMEVEGEPEREEFSVGDGYEVTWVEISGTLKPSTMGSGPSEPQPDSRLIGAIVEGPGGPWFFKATGPAETLDAARDDIRAMVESIEAAG